MIFNERPLIFLKFSSLTITAVLYQLHLKPGSLVPQGFPGFIYISGGGIPRAARSETTDRARPRKRIALPRRAAQMGRAGKGVADKERRKFRRLDGGHRTRKGRGGGENEKTSRPHSRKAARKARIKRAAR